MPKKTQQSEQVIEETYCKNNLPPTDARSCYVRRKTK